MIHKIEGIEAKRRREAAAQDQTKEEAKRRQDAATQDQAIVQTQIEKIQRQEAVLHRQIEEIQSCQAEIESLRAGLMDDLKLQNQKQQTNREQEQQADLRHQLNLKQLQAQADKLRCELEDHNKQRPVGLLAGAISEGEEKSAHQVFFLYDEQWTTQKN